MPFWTPFFRLGASNGGPWLAFGVFSAHFGLQMGRCGVTGSDLFAFRKAPWSRLGRRKRPRVLQASISTYFSDISEIISIIFRVFSWILLIEAPTPQVYRPCSSHFDPAECAATHRYGSPPHTPAIEFQNWTKMGTRIYQEEMI